MRIRKQRKQALSLIFGTLIAVFAFALLLVTIADLNTDGTPQLVSDAYVYESSQAQPQSTDNIPPPPTASEQEHTHQETPVVQPASPPPVTGEDFTGIEANPKITLNIRPILIIIGVIVLAAAIITGIVLLIRRLAHSRLYRYEVEEDKPTAEELAETAKWESDISARLPPVVALDKKLSQDIDEEKDKIIYKENRGYCFSPTSKASYLKANADDDSSSASTVEESNSDSCADISSSPASNFEYDDSGESDIDYVDIPRLFSM